jgi:hypothetical protein
MKPKKVKLAGLGCFHVVKVAEAPPVDVSDKPSDFARYWREVIAPSPFIQSDKEHIVVVALNRRLNVMGWHLVSIGDMCGTYCAPREVMRPLILCAASSFVLMHNHPSGDPSPSGPDRTVTKNLREVAKIMRIDFTDHIIVGDGTDRYFSFHEHGLISDAEPGKVVLKPSVPPKSFTIKIEGVGTLRPTFTGSAD